MCVVLYGAVEHWLSGALVNVGDDDDDDDVARRADRDGTTRDPDTALT